MALTDDVARYYAARAEELPGTAERLSYLQYPEARSWILSYNIGERRTFRDNARQSEEPYPQAIGTLGNFSSGLENEADT
jgi:hypothetical protein